jgi:hypothetical protein
VKAPKKLAGKWRITETEMWDAEELDLVGPAHLTIAADGFGSFQMVAVQGEIDCRFEGDRVEFSWVGDDDGSEVSGRGWAEVGRDGVLRGRIYFHQGDESAFVARRSRSR